MKEYFKKTLEQHHRQLLFQAHSHHAWPDVAFEAMQNYQRLVQLKLDDKWDEVFSNHIPRAQKCVSNILHWPYEKNITFGASTFELLTRLLSSLLPNKNKILTTQFEYHSARRLFQSLQNIKLCTLHVVDGPFDQIMSNIDHTLSKQEITCCFLSQSFYQTGYTFKESDLILLAKKYPHVYFIFDCYHSFAARNLEWVTTQTNVAIIAGGYKYAMSGEGCCFLATHPDTVFNEPLLNGWMAEYSRLGQKPTGIEQAPLQTQGHHRFMGATFDPIGIYRLFHVWEFWQKEKITPHVIKKHVDSMQKVFQESLDQNIFSAFQIFPSPHQGNFLSLKFKSAQDASFFLNKFKMQGIIVDGRDNMIRFGFSCYIDSHDVYELACQLNAMKEDLLKVLELPL